MSSEIQSGPCEPRKFQPGFFWIDNEIIDEYARRVGALSLAVYAVLCRLANYRTGRCYRVPHLRIAGLLAISVSTVKRCLKQLETARLIRILPNNCYEACDFELQQVRKRLARNTRSPDSNPADVMTAHTEPPVVPTGPGGDPTEPHNKEENIIQDSVARNGAGHDERLKNIRLYVQQSYISANGTRFCPWEGSEERALSKLLRRFPQISVEDAKKCIDNYFESVVNWADLPRKWIPDLLKYHTTALDEYGKPLWETGKRARLRAEARIGR